MRGSSGRPDDRLHNTEQRRLPRPGAHPTGAGRCPLFGPNLTNLDEIIKTDERRAMTSEKRRGGDAGDESLRGQGAALELRGRGLGS